MRKTLLLAALAWLAAVPVPAQEEPPRAWLGVQLGDVDAETRPFLGLPDDLTEGAALIEVIEGSPAARAGLRKGDVVTALAGQPVRNVQDLIAAVRARRPGAEIAYVVRRGSGTIEGRLTLGTMPAEVAAPREEPRPGNVEERLDRVQEEIARMRERLLEARKKRAPLQHPRSLGGWIHREELLLEEARKRGDEAAVRHHESRLSILREMRAAGQELPERQLDRIEKKVDEILARLP